MGDGKLRCCGSSLFLKNVFGVGYSMTLEKEDVTRFDSRAAVGLVLTHIPDAKLLGDAGNEMTFQLPFKSSDKFPELFRKLDEVSQQQGIRSYGVSVTTLEEVFIKIARGTNTLAEATPTANPFIPNQAVPAAGAVPAPIASPYVQSPRQVEGVAMSGPDTEMGKLKSSLRMVDFTLIPDEQVLTYFLRHLTTMFRKRRLYFFRDARSWVFQYVVPVLFVLVGMLIMQVCNNKK
jgi:hypothetical protein